MSSNDKWMPLYLGDYLADTMHLNGAQHGAYLLLLMHYWRNGPLPNDQEVLAAIARFDNRTWKSVAKAVLAFFTVKDGCLHQKRMDQERERWAEISDKRRAAGRAGADAKWQSSDGTRPSKRDGKPMANAMANAIPLPSQMPSVCQDFAIPPVPVPPVPLPVSKEDTSLSYVSYGKLSARARDDGKNLPQDGLKAILGEQAPVAPVVQSEAAAECAADAVGAAAVAAQVRRATKALAMTIPYGQVHGKWEQVEAAVVCLQSGQPTVETEDIPPAEPCRPQEAVRTVEENIAAALEGCTPEQIAKAQRYAARAAA